LGRNVKLELPEEMLKDAKSVEEGTLSRNGLDTIQDTDISQALNRCWQLLQ
jgi:hypothetical protein